MISKNEIKLYSSLLQKKFRHETGKFIVEGRKLILEALNFGFECELIISTNNFYNDNLDFMENHSVKKNRNEIVKQIEIDKLTDTKTPQGVVAVFKIPKLRKKRVDENTIIGLENISDPGNLGTIIRNCDWFGFSQIILSEDCAEIYNPKVIRASAGSVFHLNVVEDKNFFETLDRLKKDNYKIICADLNGENLKKFLLPEKSVILFCNEANGPSKELLNICDHSLTIPKKGKAESLNVASASAVILSKLSGM